MSRLTNKILEGKSIRSVITESAYIFPEKIFIVVYPQSNSGYIYKKDYEHENGGCYYSCKENTSPVDGAFISLYPDGHLTYTWNGKEQEYKKQWFYIED